MFKFILTISLLVSFLNSCSPLGYDTGINTFIKESSNNRHDKKAILFLKEATTVANSYQVTVSGIKHTLDTSDEVGNTFTVDDDHSATSLDKNSINFTWLNDGTLQIDYDKKLRTFIQESYVNRVTIVYKAR